MTRPSPLLLAALLAASLPVPARLQAAPPPPYDPAAPASWRLSAKLARGSPARRELVRALTAKSTHRSEAALTRAEAEALLDDPRAEPIYADKTVSIVAPSMLARHRQEHLDLLRAMLGEERLASGEGFVRAWAGPLEKAQRAHGVDKEVVVSILMWETRLGTITGDYVAFNAFTSQAYFTEEASRVALARASEQGLLDAAGQAKRVATIRARARRNLVTLVRQCKARKIDPFTLKGSWAGALGYPQFMPASLRWAEDGDGDGRIDLFTFEDAIASVARYLKEHGYARGRERAVYRYNHEEAYVKGVLAYADALRARLTRSSGVAESVEQAPRSP